jgi:aminopeptidase N
MKASFLIICMIIFIHGYAQYDHDYCKQVNNIALTARMSHDRLIDASSAATSASANFDVKYYRCEWTVDPAIRYIRGEVTVYFTIIASTNSISFDLMNVLTVDSVLHHNTQLITGHTNNVLQVTLPGYLSAGILDSVSIYYQGVPAISGFGAFVQASHAGIPVIWTLSEPYGSRDWWPCKNGLDDKADSIDVIVTHPSLYKTASNGLLQSETLSGANKITHWKHRYQIAAYLICFAVTNYTVFTSSVQLGNIALPMQTYCYPETLAAFQSNTPLVLNALQLYNNLFGEYPFIKEKYGQVQFGWGGGQEHQTCTFIVSPAEGLMAHELAHQWFGDKITCASWQDIWLNEGFATHLASMYMEQKYPANILSVRKQEIDYITSVPGGSVWVDDTTNINRIFNGRLSYYKGSHLLYMLRWKLGDAVFLKAIRQYHTDSKVSYGFANTDDLRRNLEQVSGKNLDEFFKDWFYGQGYPSYHVKWSQIGSTYVRIILDQSTSHPTVNFFDMPVALQFKNATHQKIILVDSKYSGEVFYSNIGFIADSVLIDPEYWIISRNNTAEKITDNVTGENVIQVLPNPVQNQFYIYLRNFSLPDASVSLYNAEGQLIFKKVLSLLNGADFEEIPSAHLVPGVYFLKIRSGSSVKFIKKILKQ